MKTGIIYYSAHHGNTKKLLDAIRQIDDKVELINVTEGERDLSEYDRIGIASGIYYGNFAKQVLAYAEKHLPAGRPVFLICTCGAPRKGYYDQIRRIMQTRRCDELGAYQCLGFDTFGPFKLIGGLAKDHPDADDIAKAVRFYRELR